MAAGRAAAARALGRTPGGGNRPISRSCSGAVRRRSSACSPAAGAAASAAIGGLVLIPLIVLAIWLASGFYRAARRAGRGAALRRVDQDHATRPELALAVADRNRVHAQGDPRQPGGGRFHGPSEVGRSGSTRRAQRKPDADRRREHRRHQFRAVVADQGRRPVPVQHPRPRADGQGGRRERDARDHRQDADRRGDHRRPRRDRAGRARADPADPRRYGAGIWSTRCSCRRSTRRAR